MKKRRPWYWLAVLGVLALAGPFVFGEGVYRFLQHSIGSNIFSLAYDTMHPITLIDHGAPRHLWGLGLFQYVSGGALRTRGDVVAWTRIPLTRRQAEGIDLCQPAVSGQRIVVSPDPLQRGIASWYGPGFHGQQAAMGESYNMYALTAAHKTVPLGSRVRVLQPLTGRSVVVRITDRGPYVAGRIIDLSYAAKRALGMGDLASVYLERVEPVAFFSTCALP